MLLLGPLMTNHEIIGEKRRMVATISQWHRGQQYRHTGQGWWCIMNSCYNVSMKSFEGIELSMDDQSWIP